MFTPQELKMTATWPGRHVSGLSARTVAGRCHTKFVEVYQTRLPNEVYWQIWKTEKNGFIVYHTKTDRILKADTLALALAIALCHEPVEERGPSRLCSLAGDTG